MKIIDGFKFGIGFFVAATIVKTVADKYLKMIEEDKEEKSE